MLAQAYPDQFSTAAIDRLRGLAPLARLIADPGKLVRRRVAQRPSLAGRDSHVLAPGGRPRPPGVSPLVPDPRFHLAAAGHGDRRRTTAGLDRGAACPGRGTGRHLDAAARNGRFARGRLPQGWLLDRLAASAPAGPGARCCGGDLRRRSAGCRRFGGDSDSSLPTWLARGGRLALLDAPRIQDVRRARSLGAAVLAKPFRVDELLWLSGSVISLSR